jgi:hypothetical protein
MPAQEYKPRILIKNMDQNMDRKNASAEGLMPKITSFDNVRIKQNNTPVGLKI